MDRDIGSSGSTDNDASTTYEPISGPPVQEPNGQHLSVQRTQSRTSSWAENPCSCSLSDGYSRTGADDEGDIERSDQQRTALEQDSEFLVKWDDDRDPMNPRNMSLWRRWLIVSVVSVGSACVTCTSSLYTTTYDQITEEFNCSRLVATLGLSFFIFGLGIGPLFLGPLSEFYGRRIIYIVSFSFFIVWIIPCAVAKNIETMIVARFFNGLAGSAFLSVAGGTVGDMFARHELGAPMMIYTASPFVGPEVGPLVGGFINYNTSWRWTFYVLIIWSGAVLVSIICFVPETYHPVLLSRKARKLREETGDDRWIAPIEKLERSVFQTVLRSIYRPMLLLTLEPMCLNLCIFSAILLGILYLFFGAFQLVFSEIYGFSLWQIGLSFLGLLAGMLFAIGTDPLWRRNYSRLVHKYETRKPGVFEPEWRLPPAIAGAFFVSSGLFIFAWTAYPHVHWIAPIIGSGLFGTGTILVYSGIFTFLVDTYPVYAASALAANSFMRSTFGAIFPLFGIQMYHRLGYNWATCLLAFLTVAMAPFPYIFYRYGKRIRARSRYSTPSG